MTDIVYVLGTGSKYNNLELRYSLRSVDTFIHNHHSLHIVGECPDFIDKRTINHIPAKDHSRHFHWRERNIMEKIKVACLSDDVSSNFLFFNDDHFLLRWVQDIARYPYYYHGEIALQHVHVENTYYKTRNNTIKLLKRLGVPNRNFDIHFPIVYNKKLFMESVASQDWLQPYGYTIKSVYCNVLGIEGVDHPDCKVNRPLTIEDARAYVANRELFSVGDQALVGGVPQVLNELFPEPSFYEA